MGKKTSTPDAGSPVATEAPVCGFEAFEVLLVPRGQITGAPYNPRRIKEANRKRLHANLKRVGLTHPITWNRRTGNLVAGHQRLDILDSLMGTADYSLHVAVVDLDPKAEREQNVFENNADAMGEWDADLVEKLIREDHIDLDNAGLDASEMVEVFGPNVFAEDSDKLAALAAGLKETEAIHARFKKATGKSEANYYRVLVAKDGSGAEWLAEFMGLPGEVFLPMNVLREKVEELLARDGRNAG